MRRFVLAVLGVLAGCLQPAGAEQHRVAGADAIAGHRLVVRHDCGVCHVIPGVRGSRGRVGPSLAGFGRRGYVAGILPNTPDNLVWWLLDPPDVSPRTAMPQLGLAVAEARQIAAFLATLR